MKTVLSVTVLEGNVGLTQTVTEEGRDAGREMSGSSREGCPGFSRALGGRTSLEPR